MSLQYRQAEVPSERSIGEGIRLLVVDDSPELLAVIEQILSFQGYKVFAASSAKDALAYLTSQNLDLILCDIMMPNKNGFDFCKEVQQNPDWCDIPFLFLTALSSEEDIRIGMELGCDDYMVKPFDPDDLISVVHGKVTLAKHRKKMHELRLDNYRRRIIHTLSHEFRTPLVSINTGAELLLEQHEALADEQVSRLLESVLRGGQRLERLVDDFMLLQQIDLGHAAHTHALYKQKLPVLPLVESAVDLFRSSLSSRESCSVEILTPYEASLHALYVKVYDVQVINALQRLLSNAQKFGGPGNLISISISKSEQNAAITIRDRGLGFGPAGQGQEDAYRAFMQINRDTWEQQGCGLGLTIARYFARLNGGSLELRPVENGEEGIEAVLYLPLE